MKTLDVPIHTLTNEINPRILSRKGVQNFIRISAFSFKYFGKRKPFVNCKFEK